MNQHQDFIDKLVEARRLVASGWMQGKYSALVNGVGCYCAMGALACAGIREGGFKISRCAIRSTDTPAGKLIAWNDKAGRTKADVLAMFDNSIAALNK